MPSVSWAFAQLAPRHLPRPIFGLAFYREGPRIVFIDLMNDRNQSGSHDDPYRVGTQLFAAAHAVAGQMNLSPFVSRIRTHQATPDEYIEYISFMYPVVVTFNRALVNSLAKLDNVNQSRILGRLLQQLFEEQRHNEMYRTMLKAHGIDHSLLYRLFREYQDNIDQEMFRGMRKSMLLEPASCSISAFDTSMPFPPVVHVLCDLLLDSACNPLISFWEHYASQSAIEAIILEVTSDSIYPGVVLSTKMNLGPYTIAWWKEHARQGTEQGRSDEEKHLRVARITLDKYVQSKSLVTNVLDRANQVMRLFRATVDCVTDK